MQRTSFSFQSRALSFYRDTSVSTGVSLTPARGKLIETPEDLPDHAIELHLFHSDGAATGFIAGVAFAGLGNDLAVEYSPGLDRFVNVGVIVARFAEPRHSGSTLEECIPVFQYDPPGHESHAVAVHTKQYAEQSSREREEQRADVAELTDAVEARGWTVARFGHRFAQVGVNRDCGPMVTWGDDPKVYRLQEDFSQSYVSNVDVSDAVTAVIESSGLAYDRHEMEVTAEASSIEEFCDLVDRLLEIHKAIDVARKKVFFDAFSLEFKLTPNRKKFLTAGAENGIGVYDRRGNVRAFSGGVDIGPSELNGYVRRGWIVKGSHLRYSVTESGRAAVGLSAADEKSETSAVPQA